MVNTGACNRRTRGEGAPKGVTQSPPSPGDVSIGTLQIATYPSACKQIWSLKRRREETEPFSRSQHQIALPLPGPWASRLPSH